MTTGFLGPSPPDGEGARAVVIDDAELRRRRTIVALEGDDRLEVVARAGDLVDGVAAVAEHEPDVVVLALDLAGEADPHAVRAVRQACPATTVVVLTTPDDDAHLAGVLAAGAAAVVGQDDLATEVPAAVRAVLAGGSVLTPVAAGVLLDLLDADAATTVRRPLALLASMVDPAAVADTVGCTPEELASRLGASVRALSDASH